MHGTLAKLTLKKAIEIAGKVTTNNSKMPGSALPIDAKKCGVGGVLVNVAGSTCERCYAIKLQKLRPSVNQGYEANYLKATTLIASNPAQWARAMAFQIHKAFEKTGQPYHRWFDSGDLASVAMLRAIVLTCELTPEIAHWLPTREAKIVREYAKLYGELPDNLTLRVSATMIGDKPRNYENTSTVHRHGQTVYGKECVAYRTKDTGEVLSEQDYKAHKKLKPEEKKVAGYTLGHCGDCRACWSKDVTNVSYPLH